MGKIALGIRGLAVLLAAGLAFMACGGAEPTTTPVPTATPVSTQAPTATPRPPTPTITPTLPKRGGTLRTNFTRNFRSHDNYPTRDGGIWYSINPELNFLVRNNQFRGELQPDLADSWTVSPDGLTFTFFLNKSAVWSDGKPVTSDDVIWSLERLQGKYDVKSPFFNFTVSNIQQMVKVDDKTFRAILAQPQGSFLAGIGAIANTIYSKATDPQAFKEFKVPEPRLPTSGPFIATQYTTDIVFKLQRNQKYWKKDANGIQLPYLDEIDIYIIPDRTAAYTSFKTGQLDVTAYATFSPLSGKVQQLKQDLPDVQIAYTSADVPLWFLNAGLTKDVRLRQAIQLAIDRQAVRDVLWRGEANPYQLYNIPGGKWALTEAEIRKLAGYNPDTRAQDIKTANDLLDAFLKDTGETRATLSTKLAVSTNINAYPTEHETVLAQLKQNLGLDLKAIAEDAASAQKRLVDKTFTIHIAGSAPAIDDPDFALGSPLKSSAGSNFGGVSDPEIDAALSAISREVDYQKRLDLSRNLERKAYQLAWQVFLGAQLQPAAATRAVKGDWQPLISQDGATFQRETVWLNQ